MDYQKRNFFKKFMMFLSLIIIPSNFKNLNLKKNNKFFIFLNKKDK